MEQRTIEFDLTAGSKGSIKVDGQEVRGVRAVGLNARLGQPTTVVLELVGYQLVGVGTADAVVVETTDVASENREFLPA